MRRGSFFSLSWSRFAQVSAAVLITLVLARAARADTIKDFIVSGTAQNVSRGTLGSCAAGATCSFSGIMMVDVTAGLVTGADITFPGLSAFTNCCGSQGPFLGNSWEVRIPNTAGETILLDFTTTPTPASLVGFAGGNIFGFTVSNSDDIAAYLDLSGTITPVPEPSS